MIHRVLQAFAAASLLALVAPGCDKPKEEDCKKAIENIIRIYGTHGDSVGIQPNAAIRTCRGSASPASVQCFIAAKTLDDLHNCEGDTFTKAMKQQAESGKGEDQGDDQGGGDSK